MAVASAGPYASLHLAPDSTPPLSFLQAGCPSCHPTNSVKALKAINKLTEAIPLIVYSLFSKPVISCFVSRASSTAGPTLDVVNPNFGLLPTWNGSLPNSTSELLVTLECNKICLVLEPQAWQKVMAAYCRVYGVIHFTSPAADCLYTGISFGPNAR